MTVRFDESVGAFLNALLSVLSKEQVSTGWILRDVSGRLAFVSATPLSEDIQSRASAAVDHALVRYSHKGSGILTLDMPGVEPLVQTNGQWQEIISLGDHQSIKIRMIDRRIVGQDWLHLPEPGWQAPNSARIVFASMKGGVGRSTSLAVLAADLAREGRKVLVLDLDLEAPGVGTMLIGENDRPQFGSIDWYVEFGISGPPDDEFLNDMVAPSHFSGGKGLIDVVPAVGFSASQYPANFLAKLSRAYLESPQDTGSPLSFLGVTQLLVDRLSSLKSYGAILIDARAGLNETTAAALLGLGADVLFFGVDTPQTFATYSYLLAHLARLADMLSHEQREAWLYRLKMVHAKASADSERQAGFRDRSYELFSKYLYQTLPVLDEQGSPVIEDQTGVQITTEQFGLNDEEAPHYAWPVLSDANYSEFDPVAKPAQLSSELSSRTYATLLNGIRGLLDDTGYSQ